MFRLYKYFRVTKNASLFSFEDHERREGGQRTYDHSLFSKLNFSVWDIFIETVSGATVLYLIKFTN